MDGKKKNLAKSRSFALLNENRSVYAKANYVIIATPTDYDPEKNFFDNSTV